jgi:hypothetical protein
VLAIGGTTHTVFYATGGTWSAGPDAWYQRGFLNATHSVAALLPSGNVLAAATPGPFQSGVHFLEFDGASEPAELPPTPNAAVVSADQERFLVLPNGQVFATDGSSDVRIYQPRGAPNAAWAPTISSVPSTLVRGTTQILRGTQLNGLSQGVAYGANVQAATNYPLVRITNDATGHVVYARTHDHSSMGVATGAAVVQTSFDVPPGAETGASHLVAVANGIASGAVAVTIQ